MYIQDFYRHHSYDDFILIPPTQEATVKPVARGHKKVKVGEYEFRVEDSRRSWNMSVFEYKWEGNTSYVYFTQFLTVTKRSGQVEHVGRVQWYKRVRSGGNLIRLARHRGAGGLRYYPWVLLSTISHRNVYVIKIKNAICLIDLVGSCDLLERCNGLNY